MEAERADGGRGRVAAEEEEEEPPWSPSFDTVWEREWEFA